VVVLTWPKPVADIQKEEEKSKRLLKESAKKGDKEGCRILAKEIVHARKAVNRINCSKAHLSSVQMSMKEQLGKLYMYLVARAVSLNGVGLG
jgi:charged multivesicular body protein 3